jgi:hypothetical protein
MKTNNLKIATIISFLIIAFPGKIVFVNVIAIFMGLFNSLLMLGIEPPNFDMLVSLVTIISVFIFFSKKKYLFLLSVVIQYGYLVYTFNSSYLKYWYYVLPVSIYLILSLLLFKLINNMKNLIVVITTIIFLSCNTHKRERFVYNLGQEKEQWINNYKTEFFIKCLQKGYKNDSIIKLMAKVDILYYLSDPLEFQHKKLDSLAHKIITEMPKPIIPHCDDCNENEENKKKLICANCLNYYGSKELDFMAQEAYKKYNKNEN